MARGDSLDAPITLDDDEEPRDLPAAASVVASRGHHYQMLDQDDIQEVEHQTDWEQAAAQRARVKQRNSCPTAWNTFTAPQHATQYAPQHVPQAAPLLPPYRSPYLPQPSTPGISSFRVAQEATQPSGFLQLEPHVRPEPAAPIHALLNHDAFLPRPVRSSILAPPSHAPAGPVPGSTVPPITLQPIRDSADHQRERATSSRVNTFERADANAHADRLLPLLPMATKVHTTCGSGVAVLPSKQRAIKSVRQNNYVQVTAPPRPSTANQEPASEDGTHAGPSNATRTRSPSLEITMPPPTSPAPNVQVSLTERPKDPDVTHQPPQEAQETNSGEDHACTSAETSSHLSVEPSVEVDQNLQAPPPTLDAAMDNTSDMAEAESCQKDMPLSNDPAPDADAEAEPEAEAEPKPKPEPEHELEPEPAPEPKPEPEPDADANQVRLALAGHVHDLIATRSAIDACLKRHIAERHEAHAYLTWSKMQRQRTCQEQDLRARHRKQKRPVQSTLPEEYIQYASPFAGMPVIQSVFGRNSAAKNMPEMDMLQEVFIKAKPKDTVVRSVLAASTTKYQSKAISIPPFKEYVSLRNNLLADNESKLLATPYFQDEDYKGREALLNALPYLYELTHDENGPLDFRKEQCRFYKDPIEAFLAEIGITWNEVLYWLLAPDKTIKRINSSISGGENFSAMMLERSRYGIEEFERDGEQKKTILFNRDDEKWRKFLSQLEQPSAEALRIAATACTAVLHECEFSIWYLAQQSSVVQKNILRKTSSGKHAAQSTYKQIMCRVCHQHNCLLHGELRQVPEDMWMTESEQEEEEEEEEVQSSHHGSESTLEDDSETDPLPAHFHDDSDIEKVINYKLPANPDAFNVCPESEIITSKGTKPPPGKFNANWWLQRDLTQHWEKRKPFFPCNHEGSCETAQCRCYREGINCEKTCKCSRSCNRRFPGCTCSITPGKRVCDSDKCLCVRFNRECDADLCGTCGATQILDPVNRYNEDVVACNCFNVAIQRGVPRKTLLGHSEVHGFGLYMGEDIEKGEYIGEYTGEAISVQEGNRRLTIYDYQKTMYLFRLNSKQEVDATYMGNKLRFINNADDKYTNCAPRNLLCNTVFRIALFATTNIKAGTELYFNYNYPKEKTEQFKQPNGKVVAVKETKQKPKKADAKLDPPIEDRSRVFAATAKARAAKAAKRAAMLEEESKLSTTRSATGLFQTRKTSTASGQKEASKARGKRASRNDETGSEYGLDADASDAEGSIASASQGTSTSQYVEETDEEEPVVRRSARGNRSAQESDNAPVRRGPGRPRKRASDVAPAITPSRGRKKKKRGVTGGARPGAGRKRKRPVILNSDDE